MKLTVAEIARAVPKSDWQKVRLSMKGKTTQEKLDILQDWFEHGWYKREDDGSGKSLAIDRQIQVQNYLNALARGGQIEPFNMPSDSWHFKHLVTIRR